jgi:hypothetical protein
MKLYVPYTRLEQATEVFLASPIYTPLPVIMVDCSSDDWAYNNYLEKVWDKGGAFINMEHDIVPWPGAIQVLMQCPYPWCTFGYNPGSEIDARSHASMFGLVRFLPHMMHYLPEVWRDRKRKVWPVPWRGMDTHFFDYATERNFYPHQHFPSVLNANPGILEPIVRANLPQHEKFLNV